MFSTIFLVLVRAQILRVYILKTVASKWVTFKKAIKATLTQQERNVTVPIILQITQ